MLRGWVYFLAGLFVLVLFTFSWREYIWWKKIATPVGMNKDRNIMFEYCVAVALTFVPLFLQLRGIALQR